MTKQVIDLRKIEKARKIKVEPEEPAEKPTKSSSDIPDKIEWVAPEFIKHKKGERWFILPGLIAVALIIIAIILKNFLFVIGIIIASLAVYTYAKKEPRKIKFTIGGKGIQIDNQTHRFEDLKSFWVFYEPPEIKELSIRSKKMFMPYIKIPLNDQNPAKIRKLLLKFLPERRHHESIIDQWSRKSGF